MPKGDGAERCFMRPIFEGLFDTAPRDPTSAENFVRACYGFFALALLTQLPGHAHLFVTNQGLSAPVGSQGLWGLLPPALLMALGALLLGMAAFFAWRRPRFGGALAFVFVVFVYFGQMVSYRQAPGVPLSGHEAHFLVPFFLLLAFAASGPRVAGAVVDVRMALRLSFVLVFWAAFWSKLLGSGLYWLEENALSYLLLRRELMGETWGLETLRGWPPLLDALGRGIFLFEALAPWALWSGRPRAIFVGVGVVFLLTLRLTLGFPFAIFLSLGFLAFLPLSWFSPRLKA